MDTLFLQKKTKYGLILIAFMNLVHLDSRMNGRQFVIDCSANGFRFGNGKSLIWVMRFEALLHILFLQKKA